MSLKGVAHGLLIVMVLGGCAHHVDSHRPRPAVDASPGALQWSGLRMQLPAGWVVEERDDHTGLIGRDVATDEDVRVTAYAVSGDTPEHALKRFVEDRSKPDPDERDIVSFTPFAMPDGQPAVMRVQDLGDDQVFVGYAIALPDMVYAVNFYRTGRSVEAEAMYSALVRSARFSRLTIGN